MNAREKEVVNSENKGKNREHENMKNKQKGERI
jgi:hypothetical protein